MNAGNGEPVLGPPGPPPGEILILKVEDPLVARGRDPHVIATLHDDESLSPCDRRSRFYER